MKFMKAIPYAESRTTEKTPDLKADEVTFYLGSTAFVLTQASQVKPKRSSQPQVAKAKQFPNYESKST